MNSRPATTSFWLVPRISRIDEGEQLTETEQNHIDTNNNGAHGPWEELADTAKHHNHAHGDVDKSTKGC